MVLLVHQRRDLGVNTSDLHIQLLNRHLQKLSTM